MAREFKVQATIVAEDQASATLRALRGEFTELDGRIDRLAASEKELATASREATTATRELSTAASQTAATTQTAASTTRGWIASLVTLAAAQRALRITQAELEETSKGVGDQAERASRVLAIFQAAVEGVQGAVSALVAAVGGGLVATFTAFTVAIEGVVKGLELFYAAASKIPVLGKLFEPFRESLQQFDDALDPFQQKIAGIAIDLSNFARDQLSGRDATVNMTAAIAESDAAMATYIEEWNRLHSATTKTTAAQQDAVLSTNDLAESTAQIVQSSQGAVVAMQQQASQALITAAAFRALAQAQGLGSAVSAAVSAGGSLSSAGRRVSIAGGSRLTNAPGLTGFVRRNGR